MLDKSTSNREKIRSLKDSNKKIYLWYSHEHSDHLSFSFLASIRELEPTILYRHTLDKRVVTALRQKGFKVEEQKDFDEKRLDDDLLIETCAWTHEDSFSIIKTAGYTLLNLNDCVIDNENLGVSLKERLLKSNAGKIDMVFTQFGYANWVGNHEQGEKRSKASAEKVNRLQIIDEHINPELIVLYASYIYFCHKNNSYMNDHQNTPKRIVNFLGKNSLANKITCLKPGDKVHFESDNLLRNQFDRLGEIAMNHWEKLALASKDIDSEIIQASDKGLLESANSYVSKMKSYFFFFPFLAEIISFIKPINIYIVDLDCNLFLSYRTNCIIGAGKREWDIEMSSGNVKYLLDNDYGFNTTSVNALFRVNHACQDASLRNFRKFFAPQELLKWGITFRRLEGWLIILKMILRKFMAKLREKR